MVRSGEPARTGSGKTPWGLIGLLIVIGLFVVFHVAVATASMFAGGQSPSLSESMAAVFDHPSNPVAGLPETAGATGWVYLFVVLYLLLIAAVVWLFRWVFTGNRSTSKKGDQQAQAYRPRYKDVESTLSYKNALAKARQDLASRTPVIADSKRAREKKAHDYAWNIPEDSMVSFLALMEKKALYGQTNHSKIVLAPPQQGKTTMLAAPKVRDAPGPCMATSTKPDLVMITAVGRQQFGEVTVFDLDGISGWPHEARWNPVAGCQDFEVALRRGQAWAGAQPIGDDVRNGGFFSSKAGAVLARLLHAAAVSGENMHAVMRWAWDLTSHSPEEALRNSRDSAAEGAAEFLKAQSNSRAGETVDSIQMTLAGLLEPLAVPRIMDQLCPPPGTEFDFQRFLSGKNTLYLIADDEIGINTAPLVSMFATEVMAEARRRSAQQVGNRLMPVFRAELDEAANMAAFPNMDTVVTDSGGRGIEVTTYFQDFSQLRSRWGEEKARTIMRASNVKYYLPGLEGPEIEDLSKQMGVYERQRISKTRSQTGSSVQHSTEQRPVMRPEEITQIPKGTAILRYENLPPLHVSLRSWWKRDDAEIIREEMVTAYRTSGKDSTQILTAEQDHA